MRESDPEQRRPGPWIVPGVLHECERPAELRSPLHRRRPPGGVACLQVRTRWRALARRPLRSGGRATRRPRPGSRDGARGALTDTYVEPPGAPRRVGCTRPPGRARVGSGTGCGLPAFLDEELEPLELWTKSIEAARGVAAPGAAGRRNGRSRRRRHEVARLGVEPVDPRLSVSWRAAGSDGSPTSTSQPFSHSSTRRSRRSRIASPTKYGLPPVRP